MLRKAVLVLGLLSLASAALLALRGIYPVALWLLVNGLALTLGVIYERSRYKPLKANAPGAGWLATGERFIDPASGALVEVYSDPRSGERDYVKVADSAE